MRLACKAKRLLVVASDFSNCSPCSISQFQNLSLHQDSRRTYLVIVESYPPPGRLHYRLRRKARACRQPQAKQAPIILHGARSVWCGRLLVEEPHVMPICGDQMWVPDHTAICHCIDIIQGMLFLRLCYSCKLPKGIGIDTLTNWMCMNSKRAAVFSVEILILLWPA